MTAEIEDRVNGGRRKPDTKGVNIQVSRLAEEVTGLYISWKAVTKPLEKVKGQLGNLEASSTL